MNFNLIVFHVCRSMITFTTSTVLVLSLVFVVAKWSRRRMKYNNFYSFADSTFIPWNTNTPTQEHRTGQFVQEEEDE